MVIKGCFTAPYTFYLATNKQMKGRSDNLYVGTERSEVQLSGKLVN